MDAQYSTSGLTCENQKTPVAATDAGSYSAPANAKLSQLQKKLAELFEMDKSDLDFGIYRVFNLKRRQIANYLEKELPRAVSALEDKALEDEVYSHLYRFFERYYVDGDFISRHFQGKDNNYVIPSNGEEVALYWANQDQYYIKSADILQDYKFKFEVPAIDSTGRDIIKTRTVKFFIVASDQVKDNNKVINDQVFAFLPARDMDDVHFLEIIDEELQIPVKNVLVNKAEKPDFMAVLTSEIDFRPGIQEWLRPALEPLTDKDGKLIPGSSLLKKHWDTYSSRRKSDFFIHKNLKKFLCGELDYYLKSMVVQNLNNATPAELEKLSKVITAIRHIAIGDNRVPGLITFLAEFENFQRKIWLKKKLVLDAGYCITLDKIPEQYYKAIVGNTAQVQEWEELGLLNESAEPQNVLAMDNLNKWAALQKTWKDHQLPGMPSLSLMANTKYMTAHNRCSILEAIGDAVDEKCDGIVINSENFQALNLMGKKFKEQIKCMYIDPPYNTGNDGFLYKDGYKSSSWLSSLYDRVYTSLPMLSDDGIFLSSIADHEVDKMRLILHELFGRENFLANFVWNNEGNIDNQSKVKVNHEYILSYCKNEKNYPHARVIAPDITQDSKLYNDTIENSITKNGPANPPSEVTLPVGFPASFENGRVASRDDEWPRLRDDVIVQDGKLVNSVRAFSGWSSRKLLDEFIIKGCQPITDSKGLITWFKITHTGAIYCYKQRENQSHVLSIIKNVGTVKKTSGQLASMGLSFSYPKPVDMVEYFCKFTNVSDAYILDYYAGSGTTAQAVIGVNRSAKDCSRRRYILVDMGDHFNNIIMPRIQKIIYSVDWKGGRPETQDKGISHCLHYQVLESYEDALNNLEIDTGLGDRADALSDEMQAQYTRNYMMEMETRDHFRYEYGLAHPFKMTINAYDFEAQANTQKRVNMVETFHYLAGLRNVRFIRHQCVDGCPDELILVVETAKAPDGRDLVVIWRDVEAFDNEQLGALLAGELNDMVRGKSVYVNGETSPIYPDGYTFLSLDRDFQKFIMEGTEVEEGR